MSLRGVVASMFTMVCVCLVYYSTWLALMRCIHLRFRGTSSHLFSCSASINRAGPQIFAKMPAIGIITPNSAIRDANVAAPPVFLADDSSDGAHSPPPAIWPTNSVRGAGAAEQEPEATAPTSQNVIMCFHCGQSIVALFCNQSVPECCQECDIFLKSTREPLANTPGCPCAQTAGNVVCEWGRRASEHCPDKVHPSPQRAVHNPIALSSCPKWKALRRGYHNLKKTLGYHKRYLQAMRESYGCNDRNAAHHRQQ